MHGGKRRPCDRDCTLRDIAAQHGQAGQAVGGQDGAAETVGALGARTRLERLQHVCQRPLLALAE